MINKSAFIGIWEMDITDNYVFIKELGAGSSGKVYKIRSKLTGEYRACKRIDKRNIKEKDKEQFITEIDLLRAADHQNIAKLYEIYEDQIYIYLIMEECLGGELFTQLAARSEAGKYYSEKEAAKIFKQLMSSVNYCHTHGICHRDIKPENILFSSSDEDSAIKLIDFGLSKIVMTSNKEKCLMSSVVGTLYYIAPEVLNCKYNEKCDIWSVGVILFIMLSGNLPFSGKSHQEVMQNITDKNYSFSSPEWQKVSQQAKELISWMLNDLDERPSSQDILYHPWVTELAPYSSDELLNVDYKRLINFAKLDKLQKSVISFVSFRLNDQDTSSLSEIFKSFDTNSDGVLSFSEFTEGFRLFSQENNTQFDQLELEQLFKSLDLNGNQLINYNEFIASSMDYKKVIKREHLYQAFLAFDSDKDGKLSKKEIYQIIKPENEEDIEYINDLFKKFDLDQDGEINYKEFERTFSHV
jgi:calcium-dependent protein kinase